MTFHLVDEKPGHKKVEGIFYLISYPTILILSHILIYAQTLN